MLKKLSENLNKLFSGRTENLNKKITIFSHDYNANIVDAFNNGYKQALDESIIKFKHQNRYLYNRCNYEFDMVIKESEIGQAATVSTGKGLSPFTHEVFTIEKQLKSWDISMQCRPIAKMIIPQLK